MDSKITTWAGQHPKLLIGAVVVGLLALKVITASPASPPADGPPKITDQAELNTLRAIVIASGYSCDQAKMGWNEGPTELGAEGTIQCGPADRDGVYENQRYRVYPERMTATVDR